MPFTLSHPAAVLLLGRTGLPVAAMVAGSMAPDLPMFVPVPGLYAATHSLVGVLTLDVLLAMVGVAVWFGLLRDALVDVAPDVVRHRLAPRARWSRAQWSGAPVAAALGALTHVVWDAFTHPHRWGVRHVAWLEESHGPLAGHQWAQYASGALGLLVVVLAAAAALGGHPGAARPRTVPELGPRALWAVLAATAGVALATALGRWPDGLHAVAFRGAVVGVIALVLGLLVLAVTWQVLVRRPGRVAAVRPPRL